MPRAWRWVSQQTYPDIEWLILDDSPVPSAFITQLDDPRIRYQHCAQRLTVGEKRNRLIAAARGEILAHFDDDDFYAPNYVESMVGILENNSADFVHLNAWYLFDFRHDFFGFWDLRQTTGLHYLCYADKVRLSHFAAANNAHLAENYLGYGFTYVYRRRVAHAVRFTDVDWGEDLPFAKHAARHFKVASVADRLGLVLHALHRGSTSSCFPQYHLPSHLLDVLFSAYRQSFIESRAHP